MSAGLSTAASPACVLAVAPLLELVCPGAENDRNNKAAITYAVDDFIGPLHLLKQTFYPHCQLSRRPHIRSTKIRDQLLPLTAFPPLHELRSLRT